MILLKSLLSREKISFIYDLDKNAYILYSPLDVKNFLWNIFRDQVLHLWTGWVKGASADPGVRSSWFHSSSRVARKSSQQRAESVCVLKKQIMSAIKIKMS